MIDQVIRLIALLQQYFISLGRFISFNVKRLGSLRDASDSKKITNGTSNGVAHANDRRQNPSKGQLKPSSELPGPKCLPLIGSLLEFNKFGPKRIHELSVDRHEQYGGIFRERLFSQDMVFVSNTSLLKQWMSQEGKFPMSVKQEPSILFAEMFPDLKRGLFFRDGEEWFDLRKLAHAIILKNASDFDTEGLFENCENFLLDYINQLKDSICGGGESGIMVDLEDRAYPITLGCTIRLVYGRVTPDSFEDYTGTDFKTVSRYEIEINICNQQLTEMPARVAKWLGLGVWKEYSSKLHHNLTASLTYGRRLREEIKMSPEKASMRTHGLLYKCMELKASQRDIDDLLADFSVDSKDPLAATLMFVTQVLACHPDIQERILEEVNQVYPSNQRITYGKSKDLEYTKAFFKEVGRLYPVAPFAARVSTEDTGIGGYHLPSGTLIMASTYAIQRDPRYFSDPLKVLPERWLGGESKSSDRPTSDSNAFTAFGLNQRLCIGQNMAISIFTLYIANLVRVFKLKTDQMPDVTMRTVLYPTHPEHPIHFEVR